METGGQTAGSLCALKPGCRGDDLLAPGSDRRRSRNCTAHRAVRRFRATQPASRF